jgi:hypothetical protein
MRGPVPPGYLVSFFDSATDERLAAYAPMPTLPSAGMVIVLSGTAKALEVTAVQVQVPADGSSHAMDGLPLYADVIVKPGNGVHSGIPEDERG